MSVFSTTCYRCHTENTSFTLVAERTNTRNSALTTAFYFCNHCDAGLSVEVRRLKQMPPSSYSGDLNKAVGIFSIESVSPAPPKINVPEYLPAKIQDLYRQAVDNLRRKNWDACGMACRKVLDITAKAHSGRNKLADKIDDMGAQHLITPQLQEWSHSIRLDGNDAAHEDIYEESEAKSIFEFMDMFVQYVHTMPGMLKARREKTEQPPR